MWLCIHFFEQLPNHLFWLLGFYWMFHTMMNLTAELFRFADRKFYADWWNAQDIRRFWKDWNIPVHRWASRWVSLLSVSLSLSFNFFPFRHVYNPLIKSGYNKVAAQLIVFGMSAFFHEVHCTWPLWALSHVISHCPLFLQYLVSVPLHMLRPWAFVAMLGQVSKGFTV